MLSMLSREIKHNFTTFEESDVRNDDPREWEVDLDDDGNTVSIYDLNLL